VAIERVCVFSGSKLGVRPEYAAAARALGAAIASRGMGVVYGGATVGLMGTLAEAAMAAGAEVIGVIPEALATKEIAHQGLARLVVTRSMHERKAMMAELSSAFVALPGGYGTFDELFEIVTWAQLGLHQKPIALFDVEAYFAPLIAMVDHAVREGFVPPDQRGLLLCEPQAPALLDALAAFRAPALGPKWIDETQT
jgi:uncharacterized protein (TIGR00730 family)